MARGRKAEPAEVKAQKAAVRSERKPPVTATPITAAARIAPPAWLKGDGVAIWRKLSPALAQAKLLSAADAATFARYCRNFARWLKLQHQLDAEGETYETETYLNAGEGGAGEGEKRTAKLKRAHPAFLIADRIERQLLAAEDRFGLNPAERQRIFAARLQTGVTGDLFTQPGETKRRDPAAQPTPPARPIEDPVGLLN
jgi:P27 family predicted phage terminase small subunit